MRDIAGRHASSKMTMASSPAIPRRRPKREAEAQSPSSVLLALEQKRQQPHPYTSHQ